MKCPKCGYNSFDFLQSCKKCGVDLAEVKSRFNLRSILFPGHAAKGEDGKGASALPTAFSPSTSPPLPHVPAPAAAEPEGEMSFAEADLDPSPFAEVDEFSLEDLMLTTSTAEAALSAPDETFSAEEGGGNFDPAEEDGRAERLFPWADDFAALDLPPELPMESAVEGEGAVGELLTFMEGIDRPEGQGETPEGIEEAVAGCDQAPHAGEEGDADDGERGAENAVGHDTLHLIPSLSVPSYRSASAAVATLPLEDFEEIDEEAGRISLEDFDRLEPEREAVQLLGSDDLLPDLVGAFTAPVGWSAPAPVAITPTAPAAVHPAAPEDPAHTAGDNDAAANDLAVEDDLTVEDDPLSSTPGAGERLAASAADLLILALVFTLFILVGELALQPAGAAPPKPFSARLLDQAIPYFLVLFCLGFSYFTFFHFLLGQTLGKMLLRLRVETSTGEAVTFPRAFLRSTGGLLAVLTAGIGYLPILRPGGRAINDRLAGTRVVKTSGMADS